jgi:trk system potassium uptake protein TrkH
MARESRHRLFISALSRPEGFLIATFAGLILTVAVLLSLPIAHAGARVSPLNALFTSTSAACVTGLIVVDTARDYSRFGQTVILVLIQFGGLGIMTFTALALQVMGRRLSFRSQVALHDVFYQRSAAQTFRRNLRWIIGITLMFESLGAAAIAWSLREGQTWSDAAYLGIFHSISAFCNAGFSVFSENLMDPSANVVLVVTVAVLIVLGGLRYTVILEALNRFWAAMRGWERPATWSLHSRVVVRTSALLIVGGGVMLLLGGLDETGQTWYARAGQALFQSITARTAGFNTINIGALPLASLLILIGLMYVGGSPGSCAGGVKTTSLAVWVARLRARLRHEEDVTLGDRRVSVDLVRRTGLLVGVATTFNLMGVLLLSATEPIGERWHLEHLVFEQISAFATVGLSTGITPHLTAAGKLWIIFSMFVGRLGPLTIAMMVIEHKPAAVRLPEERIMIG